MRRIVQLWLLSACASVCAGCDAGGDPSRAAMRAPAGTIERCPARAPVGASMPGVGAPQTTLAYWLDRYPGRELERALLGEADLARYDATVGRRGGRALYSQRDLRAPVDPLTLAIDLRERLTALAAQLSRGALVRETGEPIDSARLELFAPRAPELAPRLQVVRERTLMRCGPYDGGLYAPPVLRPYDKNACGALAPGEAVEVLSVYPNGMRLARSRYSLGWLPANASLGDGDASSLDTRRPPGPLTRRAVLTRAFEAVGSPYGLGDTGGGRDCSGLLLEIFDALGIALPRHSAWQAEAGSYALDVGQLPPAEKLTLIARANASSTVLLYLPGHIMLYLGQDARGVPMVLHSLGDFARPCDGGGETTVDVQRVVVSTLALGEGSARRSLLQRITRIVGFGAPPVPPLDRLRPAHPLPPQPPAEDAACSDSLDDRIFVSPSVPIRGAPLRVIAASSSAPAGASLRVFAPDGAPVPAEEIELGGPPHGRVVRIAAASSGRYTAVLGDGGVLRACKRIRVRDAPLAPIPVAATDPVWTPRWRWERDTENLWALFVERLFAGAADDEQTWTNLQSLLRDPHRNLLHDHLGLREDGALAIEPDCADLPYTLRAYFAWKLRLPYAFRRCSRGRTGHPPSCGAPQDCLTPRETTDEAAGFAAFVGRAVRPGVHSATGRTHPGDSNTDLYPVALSREALAPGTVYADPYGHVMMISKWYAQGSIAGTSYGALIAAEAQPDGTIGRRRFWQGTFLFDPDTTSVGAGFKKFRPLELDPKSRTTTAWDNAALQATRDFPRFALQQYEGRREDFYERMDALINPRPLSPQVRMASLLDALEEAARRRVLAVDNGEGYVREHPGQRIAMPAGAQIFETEGAWEDYATPSRDMRLLIAIDTVIDLPKRVIAVPERFALPQGATPEVASATVARELDAELTRRTIQYTRSDGSSRRLSLRELVARAPALELAYNPNDCPEVRWGAPEGSDEASTCTRRAPAAQRAQMDHGRAWFHTRTRPPRGP